MFAKLPDMPFSRETGLLGNQMGDEGGTNGKPIWNTKGSHLLNIIHKTSNTIYKFVVQEKRPVFQPWFLEPSVPRVLPSDCP